MRYNYNETDTTLADPTTRLLSMQPSVFAFSGASIWRFREKKKAQRGKLGCAALHGVGDSPS